MTNAEKFKTASERRSAYEEYRRKSSNSIAGEFHWLELECKVELLPCPFCGGEAAKKAWNKAVVNFKKLAKGE